LNGQTNANVFLKHFYVGGLQVGGGITVENAQKWIDLGADKVKDENKKHGSLWAKS
jgi:imidazole glycerol phosphate synthase subunit HisF